MRRPDMYKSGPDPPYETGYLICRPDMRKSGPDPPHETGNLMQWVTHGVMVVIV